MPEKFRSCNSLSWQFPQIVDININIIVITILVGLPTVARFFFFKGGQGQAFCGASTLSRVCILVSPT